MDKDAHVTIGRNLSDAWAQVFLKTMDRSTPLHNHQVMIPVYGQNGELPLQKNEDETIRYLVDDQLRKLGKHECHTVANTIFPISLWNKNQDRQQLYDQYLRLWKSGYLKQHRANRSGTYFQRLIAYKDGENPPKNQLEHVITTYQRGNHRASALQACIVDPAIDHTNSMQQGFPCLQHVHFSIYSGQRELEVTGIYATQHVMEKAYGNYLGLYRLGLFMAHEMGFRLTRVICTTSMLKRSGEKIPKRQLEPLQQALLDID